ncbi:MAG TPA: glycosyl hydrolase 53 family protein [Terracidiphilus sp.]|nr:glycosyl hydrolase 53 family protein [Terracidiphilus sp.]
MVPSGLRALVPALTLALACAPTARAQQPSEPVDPTPINGETYYLINQLSGLQVDLDGSASATAGAAAIVATRSFTSLTQRWALTHLPGGQWAISNLSTGLCLDTVTSGANNSAVQNACALSNSSQQWTLTAATNGYATLTNAGTGLVLDVSGGSSSSGSVLVETALGASPTQSQLWLLRPVFFRGVDAALLEKQEADRVVLNTPWWQDAGQTADLLAILKNHGVNLLRIRPTSTPPYQTFTLNGSSAIPATCTGNGCYAEVDSADLNVAKRAKQLGMSIELTLFFDGGSSSSVPGAWSTDNLTQLQSDVYAYVKAEIESYRSAGVMPDLVSIGNEVDTGLFGSLASPGTSFSNFAAVENQAMQAVLDASSDTSIGPAIPPPLRCIHITPGWNLSSFFSEAASNNIPFDAICQSYYPFYHGPLTAAQAAASNPDNQPVEQTVLTSAATSIGVPIFIIETGEHYESGFDANDPWYPATVAGQRQFLIDLDTVLKGLPNHLGMGMDYWDAEGVNTPASGGGFTNGDGDVNATYIWNGLTIFDNADASGATETSAANYSAILAGADALGGKIDPTLSYALVNVASGELLSTAGEAVNTGTPLGVAAGDGGATLSQQWSISSNGDGYLQIANLDVPQGSPAQVLDNAGSTASGSAVVLNSASSGDASQEWNLVTAGSGQYTLVNKASGLVLAATAAGAIQQQSPASTSLDWITPANSTQLWQVMPIHITEGSTTVPPNPTFTVSASQSSLNLNTGASSSVTLTLAPTGGYQGTVSMSCASTLSGLTCSFNPASYSLPGTNASVSGSVTITAPATIAGLSSRNRNGRQSISPAALCFPSGAFCLLFAAAARKRALRRLRSGLFLLVLALFIASIGIAACGGGASGGSPPPKSETGTVTVTAVGSSGNLSQSVAISVTVTQ